MGARPRFQAVCCFILFLSLSPTWGVAADAPEHAVMTAVARAGDRLVAAGERGVIRYSDDNGRHWQNAQVPVKATITSVYFVSARAGWAAGHTGVVLETSDGGASWGVVLDGKRAALIEAEAAKAAAAAEPTADNRRRLRDAERLVAEGADKPFLDIHFLDEARGLVVGAYGLAFATADGGKSWASMMGATSNPTGRHLYSIANSGTDLFVVGEQGLVLRSADAGKSFVNVPANSRATFFGAVAGRQGHIIAFGLRGNLQRSVDAGATWAKIDMPPISLTGGVRRADGAVAIVDELGHVFESRDDGHTFEPLALREEVPAVGIVEAADRSLILAGIRGATRAVASDRSLEVTK